MASSHLIVTVHGIRTFGQWQERLELLNTAAEQGVVTAYADLGQAYFDGAGVVQDRAQALRLWQIGIHQRDPRSHEDLGNALSNGKITRDLDQALQHFAIA